MLAVTFYSESKLRPPHRGTAMIFFLMVALYLKSGFSQTTNSIPPNSSAEVTNSIPTNLFLTIDQDVFSYWKYGRLVSINKIEDAKKSDESRPAEQDTEGNWGLATNGFQVSLRTPKTLFTNGESIPVTTLMRNVTTNDRRFFLSTHVSVSKDGIILKRKDDSGVIRSSGLIQTVYPQSQYKFVDDIAPVYDFRSGGEYVLKAYCGSPPVTSRPVIIRILSTNTSGVNR